MTLTLIYDVKEVKHHFSLQPNWNLKIIQGLQILRRAADLGDENIMKTFVSNRNDVDPEDGIPLHWAAINGRLWTQDKIAMLLLLSC